MKQHPLSTSIKAILRGSALAGACALTLPAQALEFEFDNGFLLNVDTTLGYSAAWRTESRDKGLEAAMNNNDGNNSFDSGSMTSSKINMILEVGGEYEDFSFFVRGDAMYDYVYADASSDMTEANYQTFNNGTVWDGNVDRGDFPGETIDEHGRRLRLLDAFIQYNFDLGDQGGSMRFGKQVISWGGSRFYPGINGLQNPNDGAAALSPGVETKEIFLPTSAFDIKYDINLNWSAEAYYKLDWKETVQPGVASFLSSSDFTGPGSETILLGPLGAGAVTQPEKPDDDGQWGTAIRYMTDMGTTFELSYANSHTNIPGAVTLIDFSGNSEFYEVYAEDVPAWSLAITGNIGEAEVYVDALYSDDAPFVLLPPFGTDIQEDGRIVQSTTDRGHFWQVSAGFTDVYTAFPWLSEQVSLLAEVHYQGNNIGGDSLDYDGGRRKVTDTAWGYQFAIALKYFQVIRGMDLTVPITFKHDVDGYGNAIMLNGLKEDQMNASIGVTADYLSNWTFQAKYNWYFGEAESGENGIIDRDNFAISAKYRF